MTFDDLLNALKDTKIKIFNTHKKSSTELPYACYNEYMQVYRRANNRISSIVQHIQVDLYTDLLDYESPKKVRQALDGVEISFDYKRFDEEKLIHHVYDCEVFEDG